MNAIPICRACRTREANSGEHLLQSAIGGRLEVPGVLCKPCNDRFGRTIDGDLAAALEWFRMMLAIEGDRGQTASIRTVDGDGRHHFSRPGLLPESAETRPTVVKVDENTFNLTAYSEKQARQLVEAYQRKRPGETLIVKEVKVQKIFPTKTTVPMNLRGDDFFRPAVKTVLVLLAHLGLESHDALVNAWRYVNGERAEDCDLKVFWSSDPAPWSDDALGAVSHRVSLKSDSETGLVTADVRYFGDFAFCIRIGAHFGDLVRLRVWDSTLSPAELRSGEIGLELSAILVPPTRTPSTTQSSVPSLGFQRSLSPLGSERSPSASLRSAPRRSWEAGLMAR